MRDILDQVENAEKAAETVAGNLASSEGDACHVMSTPSGLLMHRSRRPSGPEKLVDGLFNSST